MLIMVVKMKIMMMESVVSQPLVSQAVCCQMCDVKNGGVSDCEGCGKVK